MTSVTFMTLDRFIDTPAKGDILAACDYGRATRDWNPLLKRLSIALRDRDLCGPFIFHAEMTIDGQTAYNWCIMEIDMESVEWLDRHLIQLGGFEVIQKRYADYFGRVPPRPNHMPARILAINEDGNAGHPAQLAWFLDQYLPGIDQANVPYICGIELISSWESRFVHVYRPAAARVLDVESNQLLTDLTGEFSFSALTTLYAMLHDTGHWSGTMACLPTGPAFSTFVTGHEYAALGELATDMASIALVTDLTPGVSAFVLLSRLFDYMHRGLGRDPLHYALNHHQDTLANSLMFERLRKGNGLVAVGDQWHLDMEAVQSAALKFSQDLEVLGADLTADVEAGRTDQIDRKIAGFIEQDVPCQDGEWEFPTAVHHMLNQIAGIPLILSCKTLRASYPLQDLISG